MAEEKDDFIGGWRIERETAGLNLYDVLSEKKLVDKYSSLTGLLEPLTEDEFHLVQTIATLISINEIRRKNRLNEEYVRFTDIQIAPLILKRLYDVETLSKMKDPVSDLRVDASRVIKKLMPGVVLNYRKQSKSLFESKTNLRVLGLWCLNIMNNIVFDSDYNAFDLTNARNKASEYSHDHIQRGLRSIRSGEIIDEEESGKEEQ